MMVPRFMLVTAAVGIIEADLSIPLRGLNWIATLPSLNIARTLGEPSRTYRFVRNAMYVPFSTTIHLRPVLVEAESPCVLDLLDFILTYKSACCGNILIASNKLTPRTVSAHRLGSASRRTVFEVSHGLLRSPICLALSSPATLEPLEVALNDDPPQQTMGYLGVVPAPNAKSQIRLGGRCFRLDYNGCGFRRCRFCFVDHVKVRKGSS